MKKSFILFIILQAILHQNAIAQTRIAKEQIEDAFLQKSGGDVYGDVHAATSTISASTFNIVSGDGIFHLVQDGSIALIRSDRDLVLDPTNGGTSGAIILAATTLRFQEFLGDKITLYSHSYKIGVSPFDLDITTDRNVKFHTDTVEDLMVIEGDQGDVLVKQDILSGRDLRAGNIIGFRQETAGDKILLYGNLYRIAISSNAVDFYSDRDFKWHSDQTSNAMILDGDTGTLTLKGPLQLPVYNLLPSGSVGALIYLDHLTDDSQDGAYIYTHTGWQKI